MNYVAPLRISVDYFLLEVLMIQVDMTQVEEKKGAEVCLEGSVFIQVWWDKVSLLVAPLRFF